MTLAQRNHRKFHRLFRSSKGTFTIEATFVFPIVMLCVLALLFFGVYVYERVVIQQIAQHTTERTAFVWDNSHKDHVSGNYSLDQNDGLYWRLTGDHFEDLFSLFYNQSSDHTSERLTFPIDPASTLYSNKDDSPSLSRRKLSQGITQLPSNMKGSITFTNRGFDRIVSVELERPLGLPASITRWLSMENIQAKSESRVTDPVELIRLTDLARTYIPVISSRISPDRVKSLMVEPEGNLSGKQVIINSESDAAEYLRSLVSGTKQKYETTSGNRDIDALDATNGIAHQAIYTFNEAQLLNEQLPKDVDLLEKGKLKGVVWHFFKQKNSSTVVVSSNLRAKLERRGIVVVLHE